MEAFIAPFLTRGTCKSYKDPLYLTFARKLAFNSPFQSKKHLKLRCLTGMWPGLNFINILCTAFMHADLKSVKKTVKLSIFLTLLGSMSIKAVLRTLMKLTPAEDFYLAHIPQTLIVQYKIYCNVQKPLSI